MVQTTELRNLQFYLPNKIIQEKTISSFIRKKSTDFKINLSLYTNTPAPGCFLQWNLKT